MKKILLLGLQGTSNIGDRLVCECTEKMIEKYLSDCGETEIQIVSYDMLGKDYYKYLKESKKAETERKIRKQLEKEYAEKYPTIEKQKELRRRERFPKYYKRIDESPENIKRLEEEKIAEELRGKEEEERHAEELKEEKRAALLKSAESSAKKMIDADTVAVIFVGGGLIKYGHPLALGYVMSYYIRRADALGVPVMINAVGVDGYDENDNECAVFAEILNLPCVKYVSARDDIETLREKYISSSHVKTEKVPCPACMTKTLFPMGTLTEKATVGLGMVKMRWLLDRNPDMTENDAFEVWKCIIDELERRGYDWKIFCNGLGDDFDFGIKLLKYIGRSAERGKKVLPNPKSVHQLLDSLNMFEGIIACRFHAAVPAYSYGIPFVEIIWNDKQTYFGEWANISDRFFELKNANAALVVDKLEEAMHSGYPENGIDPEVTEKSLRTFFDENVQRDTAIV